MSCGHSGRFVGRRSLIWARLRGAGGASVPLQVLLTSRIGCRQLLLAARAIVAALPSLGGARRLTGSHIVRKLGVLAQGGLLFGLVLGRALPAPEPARRPARGLMLSAVVRARSRGGKSGRLTSIAFARLKLA